MSTGVLRRLPYVRCWTVLGGSRHPASLPFVARFQAPNAFRPCAALRARNNIARSAENPQVQPCNGSDKAAENLVKQAGPEVVGGWSGIF